MKKEKTVRTYQRRTKSGKMVTVREHKASYDAAEEARKAAAKKAGAGSELSKKKAAVDENPLGFSADDYKEWYHWDMEDDPKNEAALRVEKALTKKMGKKAYNKYLEDMSNSYSARGHKKAHQALLDEHTSRQKKQDAEISKTAKDIARGAKEKASEAKTSKAKSSSKKETKDSDLVEHYDQFNKKSMGKAVGDSFTFSEGRGKDKFTYDARFVTDGKGRYGYVVRDKAEGPDAKYYVGISDGYERHSQLPAGLRKAAEAQGLRFKNGEFVKKETKGDRAVARMNKLVNEALSSTTSDPKALKKQLGALIDYNGGPMNYGDKIGKRIDEIREQLGKRSSKKRVDKKSDYDYETSMKNLENYFAEERRKITSKKSDKPSNKKKKPSTKTSGGAPTSAALRKKADEMDAREKKAKIAEKVGEGYKTIRKAQLNNPASRSRRTLRGNVYISSDGKTAYYEDPTNKGKLKKASATLLNRLTKGKEKLKAKEEYMAYKKLVDEKKKTGKRLSFTETTKLKKLAKAAGVGRFIE